MLRLKTIEVLEIDLEPHTNYVVHFVEKGHIRL